VDVDKEDKDDNDDDDDGDEGGPGASGISGRSSVSWTPRNWKGENSLSVFCSSEPRTPNAHIKREQEKRRRGVAKKKEK